jgi:hypothetical protein
MVAASARQSDLAWINRWLTIPLLIRFVQPNSRNNFCLLPIWGFSNAKKGIQDYDGGTVIAQRNTHF